MICVGHMHLKGCYDWFRPPKTKYEIWKDQHEKKKRKREQLEREQEIQNKTKEIDRKAFNTFDNSDTTYSQGSVVATKN